MPTRPRPAAGSESHAGVLLPGWPVEFLGGHLKMPVPDCHSQGSKSIGLEHGLSLRTQ